MRHGRFCRKVCSAKRETSEVGQTMIAATPAAAGNSRSVNCQRALGSARALAACPGIAASSTSRSLSGLGGWFAAAVAARDSPNHAPRPVPVKVALHGSAVGPVTIASLLRAARRPRPERSRNMRLRWLAGAAFVFRAAYFAEPGSGEETGPRGFSQRVEESTSFRTVSTAKPRALQLLHKIDLTFAFYSLMLKPRFPRK